MTKVVLLASSHRVTKIVGRFEISGPDEGPLAASIRRAMRERRPVELAGRSRTVLAIHSDARAGVVTLDVDA